MTERRLVVNGTACSIRVGDRDCDVDGLRVSTDIAHLGQGRYSVLLDGQQCYVTVAKGAGGGITARVRGESYRVEIVDPRRLPDESDSSRNDGGGQVQASMPGKVVAVYVKEGQKVTSGQDLLVVEAMKMRNALRSPLDGTVASVSVRPGDSVGAGEVLAIIE